MKQTNSVLLCAFLFLILLFCGCGTDAQAAQTTPKGSTVLSGGEAVSPDSTEIRAVVTPEDLALLDGFPNLVLADFSGSSCYKELMAWEKDHPQVSVRYTVPFPGDILAENSAEELDLTGLKSRDADTALEALVGGLEAGGQVVVFEADDIARAFGQRACGVCGAGDGLVGGLKEARNGFKILLLRCLRDFRRSRARSGCRSRPGR